MPVDKEEIPGGAAGAGMAAFALAQKIFIILLDKGIISPNEARACLRDIVTFHQEAVDTGWRPNNEVALHLLTSFADGLAKNYWPDDKEEKP